MVKSTENLTETVRHDKHAFGRLDHYPKKARKHRYERRKIREYLQHRDWTE